jgi:hypothetical protein
VPGERQAAAGEHPRRAGQRLALPHRRRRSVLGPAIGRQVQQRGEDVVARDAVDRRVVNLAVDRLPAAGQALDEIELPERSPPVERAGMETGDLVCQLAVVAR